MDWDGSELLLSYGSTGYQFPVGITGAGGKSKYAPYRSNEAMLLPGNRRTAALQGLCLRHLIQNLETVLEGRLLPNISTHKCTSLTWLGFWPPVAGVPCRPRLPNFQATLQFVRDYICSLNGGGVLNTPLFQPNVVPTLTFAAVDELSVVERFNSYSAQMKKIRNAKQKGGG